MDLRSIQQPLKQHYRDDPGAAVITLRAQADSTTVPTTCSVDIGRAVYEAEAHAGVGGSGGTPCSGDLLLGALAACAQITCQMVAAASGIPLESASVAVEGELDLRGTLGLDPQAPVGFRQIQVDFDLRAPQASAEELTKLKERTERYCVVLQTLLSPPEISVSFSG
ncbi:MAG TPA: OsmC family protein [Dehalococcoidia bacterium]|nr:OsmC family protein [Dehalococcoidia bacterium]